MLRILATGTSGTIGKHFSGVVPLSINLLDDYNPIEPSLFNSSSVVLHAAGIVGNEAVSKDINFSRKINIAGTKKLAEISRDNAISRFIYVSSSHVYAPSDSLLLESSKVDPVGPYAEQKFEAEQTVVEVFKETPEKLCIVRVFSVLDWDVADFTLGGAIKNLTISSSDFKLSNSDDVRDFLTPKLIASILIKISQNTYISGIINLSSGCGTAIREAARKMLTESGFEFPSERVLPGNSIRPYMVGDNSKLISYFPNLDLFWQPSLLK
jgi:UDP-glucose 4-epimerase/GDP-4-dehydro-6-deoxy-D-mannose reductase